MNRVVVLYGGQSTEHEVSLASGADVVGALEARHSVVGVRIDEQGGWHIDDGPTLRGQDVLDELEPDDVVFPVLHGGWGENGGLQRELEVRGIRFVGSSAGACEIGMSKLATAQAAAGRAVSTIPVRVLHRAQHFADPDLRVSALARAAEWPLIVKPNAGGSSVGVFVVRSRRELRAALEEVFRLDPIALLQPLISGSEVSVGVWAGADGVLRATGGSLLHLPDGEDAFSYDHKYAGAGGWLEIPAKFSVADLTELRRCALEVAAAVGVRGLARVDFFVTADGVVLNEINTMPGIRRESHFSRLVAAAGVGYEDLLDGLITNARARRGQLSPV